MHNAGSRLVRALVQAALLYEDGRVELRRMDADHVEVSVQPALLRDRAGRVVAYGSDPDRGTLSVRGVWISDEVYAAQTAQLTAPPEESPHAT